MSDMKLITREEWHRKGTELFGEEMWTWEFVCPSCGNVQKPNDFMPYKDKGATPDSATKECIGRYSNTERVDMCSGKSPCNYASYGLIQLCTTKVVDEDKNKIPVFAFNEEKCTTT